MRRIATLVFIQILTIAFVAYSGDKKSAFPSFGSYVITNFTADNGLPQNTVDVVKQTSDGYLWIGVHFGSRGFGHRTTMGFIAVPLPDVPGTEFRPLIRKVSPFA